MSEHPLERFIPDSANPQVLDYWTAVGRFMTSFADMETKMQVALWSMAGTDSAVSKAVFSGVRIDQAMNFIKRIVEANGRLAELKGPLEYVFQQLAGINNVRNNLVHYGPQWDDATQQSATVGNRLTALTRERRTEIRITPDDLRRMCCDLDKISQHLFFLFIPGRLKPSEWQTSVLQAPWLYKLPVPKGNQKKSLTRTPKQSRPPRPYAE